jgi:hypothetical protein
MSKSTNQKDKRNQHQRFIEAAREAGASEDETVFRENLKRIAKPKAQPSPKDENKPVQ